MAVATASMLPAAAAAQEPQPPGDSVRIDTVRRLAPVTVTSARLSVLVGDIPLVREHLSLEPRHTSAGGISRPLLRAQGVSFFDDQGTAAQPTLDVRGFQLSPVVGVGQGLTVFLDGVRINEPDAHQVYFDLLPPEALAGVEVVRGSVASFGKNTLAGSVLTRSRRGDETRGANVGLTVGRFGARALSASGGTVAAGLDLFGAATASDEDGYREASRARTRSLFANVGHRGQSGDAVITVLVARDRLEQPGSLPESWLAADPRTNYTAGDFFQPELTHLVVRGERWLGRSQLRGHAFSRRNSIQQFNANVADAHTRAFILNRSRGVTAELAYTFRASAPAVTASFGGEYERSRVRHHIFGEPHEEAPEVDDDCDAQSGECERATTAGEDLAAFVEVLAVWGERFSVSASARHDGARLNFRDLRDPGNDGDHRFSSTTYRLAADARLLRSLRALGSMGTGFRVPAALELACADEEAPCPLPFSLGDDPPLEPVRVVTTDATLEWQPLPGALIALTAFRTDVRDEIMFVASGASAAGFFQNVRRTRRAGYEGSVRTALGRMVNVSLGHSVIDATFRSRVRMESVLDQSEAEPGDRLPLVPRHRSQAAIGITRAGAAVVSAALRFTRTGPQFLRGDAANEERRLPSYGIAALDGQWTRGRTTVAVSVDNLFDRRYATFGTYALNPRGAPNDPGRTPLIERFLTPGYPRSVSLSVAVRN